MAVSSTMGYNPPLGFLGHQRQAWHFLIEKKKKKKTKTFHNDGNVFPYSPQTVCGHYNKFNGIDDNKGLRGPAPSSPYPARIVVRVWSQVIAKPTLPFRSP